ncbi:hypothetical protein LWF15_27100 [Kineosporia rhizophila]|uniref:hypothetical protein n=1 Tax=Kineosporia rhizophila TaxID=84633 RepID=UPI001E4F9017|nr:hypothetical protein [Kineosporia rhizophila]MCE0539174.1 hypothetical protein [Kineosporia rhizophila]
MIDSLDEIDWSRLEHAYGNAGDTPGLVRQLRKDDWSEAVEELLGSILYQGGVYPATLAALPFLVEVALDDQAPGRLGALQLLYFYGQSVAAGAGQEDPSFQAEARAGLDRSARSLAPLAEDPDPDVRAGVYECACYWPDAGADQSVGRMLRARFAAETDLRARVALMEPMARHRVLGPADLTTLTETGQDDVLFAAVWCALAVDLEMPSVLEHLVRLWPSHAAHYPGLGASNSLALLVQRAGPRALPLLEVLAERLETETGAQMGVGVGDLAYAWCDVAQISRSATPSAVQALIDLAQREESPDVQAAQQIVAAFAAVLPAAEEQKSSITDVLAHLLDNVSTNEPKDVRAHLALQASIVSLLFVLEDPRWAAPAREAVATGEHLMVSTGLNGSTSLPVLLARVSASRPVAWARADLTEVARTALAARPTADGSWAEVLSQLPPSEAVVDVLLQALAATPQPSPEPVVLKALTQLAVVDSQVFTEAARARIRELPPAENEAGAWLLTLQTWLDPAASDPGETFDRVWQLAGRRFGADELLRAWSHFPSPALLRAAQEEFTGWARDSLPDRHLQLVAASVMLGTGDPARIRAAWPTVQAVIDRAGEPLAEAASIAGRMVHLVPELGPEWLDQLWDIADHGRQTWSEPDHVATAVALAHLLEENEMTAEEAVERALAVEAEAARSGRVVRVTPVVAGLLDRALVLRPDLHPRVAEALEPLICGDERIPSAADEIATDAYLVRILADVAFRVRTDG